MSGFEALRAEVCEANRFLGSSGLVTLTWGNVSGISDDRAHVAIKPSGVAYDQLRPQDIVVVDLAGTIVAGDLRPSSDTATHLELYRNFDGVGGITHTHSPRATAFAQARRPIECYGTTHADHFHGAVPVTRVLSAQEVDNDYELNTGKVIVECFASLDPVAMPAVLVAGHAPFTWGPSVQASVDNAVALEAVAAMAIDSLLLDPDAPALERHVLDKHYRRKHGAAAYYGQETDDHD